MAKTQNEKDQEAAAQRQADRQAVQGTREGPEERGQKGATDLADAMRQSDEQTRQRAEQQVAKSSAEDEAAMAESEEAIAEAGKALEERDDAVYGREPGGVDRRVGKVDPDAVADPLTPEEAAADAEAQQV